MPVPPAFPAEFPERPRSAGPSRSEFRYVHLSDPLTRPLLDELAHEYSSRYGRGLQEQVRDLHEQYPAAEFSPPGGALVLLLEDGDPVSGGAFRRYDAETAELKRMWTHSAHRRRGLGGRIIGELEGEALRRGYARMYLTTGTRQPEARALYLAAGYTPLFDTHADPAEIGGPLPFEKRLGAHGPTTTETSPTS